ncbi:MAG: YjiH family protein [Gemmatimonadetes bacterium]|nr:YjiH family protein [Gemmatimonadota bacterium]MXX73503.1 YjiH family protein [Gemmatimonadota bacterium]MYC92055.1 YjiH family protein [Gemmatimonadota bacterium]MYG36869.1 YjiH family protein [Gemmatimonadota bacterium]
MKTLRFVLPSLVGVAMFLAPYPTEAGLNIGLGVLTDWAKALLDDWLPAIAVVIVCLSALLSLYALLARPAWARDAKGIAAIFAVSRASAAVRAVGAVVACMILLGTGPAWITSGDTGGVILNDLMTVITIVFVFASFLLPFLTDFGLMEFIGTMLRRVVRPLFRLPGRAAVDAAASWFGSSIVGLVITTEQYDRGYYTEREALVIALNFSVVSVAFAKVVTDFAGLGEHFLPLYGTVVVSGLVAAVIVPRLPPLSRKRELYSPAGPAVATDDAPGPGLLARSLALAGERAARAPGPAALARHGLRTTFDVWFGLLPLVMVIGTASLAVANHTPIFDWLSYPLVPFAELLQLPEAAAAAPALLVGFADQFLPVILGQSIESELTRFVIACAAVTQLVYMSEVGAYLLKSKLSVSLPELFVVFVLRTLITVPICALFAHMIF